MDSLFRAHRPSLNSDLATARVIHQFESPIIERPSALQNFINTPAQKIIAEEVVQSLLGEIKKAYASILEEKEEHIFQLKEEVADLKTLVCVLEGEVKRLSH
jgi:hypothetical protein